MERQAFKEFGKVPQYVKTQLQESHDYFKHVDLALRGMVSRVPDLRAYQVFTSEFFLAVGEDEDIYLGDDSAKGEKWRCYFVETINDLRGECTLDPWTWRNSYWNGGAANCISLSVDLTFYKRALHQCSAEWAICGPRHETKANQHRISYSSCNPTNRLLVLQERDVENASVTLVDILRENVLRMSARDAYKNLHPHKEKE